MRKGVGAMSNLSQLSAPNFVPTEQACPIMEHHKQFALALGHTVATVATVGYLLAAFVIHFYAFLFLPRHI